MANTVHRDLALSGPGPLTRCWRRAGFAAWLALLAALLPGVSSTLTGAENPAAEEELMDQESPAESGPRYNLPFWSGGGKPERGVTRHLRGQCVPGVVGRA